MSKARVDRSETFMAEVEDLQKKFRNLELDRKARLDMTSAATINKVQQQVETLKKENEKLKRDLELETRQAKLLNSSQTAVQIGKMQSQSDTLVAKIDAERKKFNEYSAQIANARDTIYQLRKSQRGMTAGDEISSQIQKKIHALENKLDKALVKLNEALTHNKNLRETIENLRRERGIFDGVYKKLESELKEKKKEMLQIIDTYNESYAKRDEVYSEMNTLKLRADEEQKRFEHEWRKLSNLVQDRKSVSETTSAPNAVGLSTSTSTSPAASTDAENQLRRRLMLKSAEIEADNEAIHKTSAKVREYETLFFKIQTETGISDMDQLVSTFSSSEDQNFSLFNYVNDLNAEIEQLDEEIDNATAERDKYSVNAESPTATNDSSKRLSVLDATLSRNDYEQEHTVRTFDDTKKAVEVLKTGVDKLFQKLQLDTGIVTKDGEMSDTDLMNCLILLEQFTDKQLLNYLCKGFAKQSHPNPEHAAISFLSSTISGTQPLVAAHTATIPDIPHSVSEDDDDEEEDLPMNLAELHSRARKDLNELKHDESKTLKKKQSHAVSKGRVSVVTGGF